MALKGNAYTKTSWAFEERPVTSSKLNLWDDRIEAALELLFRLVHESYGGVTGVLRQYANELKVSSTPIASLSVEVLPGLALINGAPCIIAEKIQTVDVTPPTGFPRCDLVQARLDTWDVSVKTGTEASSPSAPNPDSDAIGLAKLMCIPGMIAITNASDGTNGYIIDDRHFI